MEFNPIGPISPENSDDSSKKEKKSRRKAVNVPVPVSLEAMPSINPEIARIETGKKLSKKEKKKSKKAGEAVVLGTVAIEKPKEVAEKEEPKIAEKEKTEAIFDISKEETAEDSPVETAEETFQPEALPENKEVELKVADDFEWDVPISDRAQRQVKKLEDLEQKTVEIEQNDSQDVESLEKDIQELEAIQAEANEVIEDMEPDEEKKEDDQGQAPTPTTSQQTPVSNPTPTTSPKSVAPSPAPWPSIPMPTPPVNGLPAAPSPPVGGGNVYPTINSANLYSVPAPPTTIEVVSDKRKEARNLLTGVLVGGLIEHVRHKRRERKMEKEHAKEIKNLTDEQRAIALKTAEKEKAAAQTQTTLEKKLARLKEAASANNEQQKPSETLVQNRQLNTKEAEKPSVEKPVAAEALVSQPEQIQPQPTLTAKEKLEQMWAAEKLAAQQKQQEREDRRVRQAEEVPRPYTQAAEAAESSPKTVNLETDEQKKTRLKNEQIRADHEEQVEVEERDVPDDRRVETSAWHNIEVDKKTGKAVENPTVEYGEEFKREQEQESIRRKIQEASIESENMRERYVAPHLDVPKNPSFKTEELIRQQDEPLVHASDTPSVDQTQTSNYGVMDFVLWGILAVVIILIIVVLTT